MAYLYVNLLSHLHSLLSYLRLRNAFNKGHLPQAPNHLRIRYSTGNPSIFKLVSKAAETRKIASQASDKRQIDPEIHQRGFLWEVGFGYTFYMTWFSDPKRLDFGNKLKTKLEVQPSVFQKLST